MGYTVEETKEALDRVQKGVEGVMDALASVGCSFGEALVILEACRQAFDQYLEKEISENGTEA